MKAATLVLILLSGCAWQYPEERAPRKYPYGVNKFSDGDVTCYIYFQHSISCVRTE